MNKKGTEYMLFLTFIVIIIIITIIVNLYGKYQTYKEQVGTSQFYLMKTYEDGEQVLSFIDSSVRQAFMMTLYNGTKTGFMFDNMCSSNPDEKDYYGYRRINTNKGSCLPSFLEKIKQDFSYRLGNYLKNFTSTGIPYKEYRIYLVKEDKGFSLITNPENRLKLDLTKNSGKKCCARSIVFLKPDYFTIEEGECTDLNPIMAGESTPSVSYYEVNPDFCYGEIYVTEESYSGGSSTTILIGNNDNDNSLCSYCGNNRILVETYSPEEYINNGCSQYSCCYAKCPPGSNKISIPYYSQCSFGSTACSAACGPVSLKMALDGLNGGNADLATVWQGVGAIGTYTTTYGIVNYANSFSGIAASCTGDITWNNLKAQTSQGRPVILLANMPIYNDETARGGSNAWHFMMVVGTADNEIIVHDPYPCPGYLPNLYNYGAYLVLRKDTLMNRILPSTLGYVSDCGGIIISKSATGVLA